MKYDLLIVGAGLSGAVFAEQAKRKNLKVLIIDQRDHIGGNCYTKNVNDINVHVYGPHIFHTSSKKIWQYINKFAKFNHFSYRPRVNYENRIYSFPINLMTFYQLWGVTTPDEAQRVLNEKKIKIQEPKNLEEWVLSQVGEEVYEKFIYGYTKKQWMKEPKELPASIIKRIPFRLTYDDRYYDDVFEGIPEGGYTKIFEAMFDGCDIRLNVDFFHDRNTLTKIAKKIIYTGKVDQYYDYCFGELEYRTLNFDHKNFTNDYQGVAGINYTSLNVPYTRVIEHKHFEFKKSSNSIVTFETPTVWTKGSVPYYPINDEKNSRIYQMYKILCNVEKNVVFTGRLSTYRYMDMHQVIAEALEKFKKHF